MDRHQMLQQLGSLPTVTWDVLVIGGGATGLGVALDSSSRGYRTLLLEQEDFAKGTSSRSTKLVHGGVRYLQEGELGLVREALYERGLLLRNAPHLVHKESFIIPVYTRWAGIWYTVGLKVYDLLSGKLSFGRSRHIGKGEVIQRLPGIRAAGLTGGVLYLDGKFNDARLAINLAQTAVENGAVVLNHFTVRQLLKDEEGNVYGAVGVDNETGRTYEIVSKSIVNATGVFVDDIFQMDTPRAPPQVRPSQGIHLVMDLSFMGHTDALMIPHTEDGRVLFAVPWEGKLLVGTTDTPLKGHSLEPRALEEEVDFILRTAAGYFQRPPTRKDVLSVFAGLRPLAAPRDGGEATKEISRSHKIIRSPSGLVTITGGKWTTYRRMAEDTVDAVIKTSGLTPRSCRTHNLPIHGAGVIEEASPYLAEYGTDGPAIDALLKENPAWNTLLHVRLPYTAAQVIWAVRMESALTVEDVLARRTRALFLDARAAIEAAPVVAALMASERGKDNAWERAQIDVFSRTAAGYLLT